MEQLNKSILEAALEGLEAQRAKIDEHISTIRSMLGRRGPERPQAQAVGTETPQQPRKRRMSAAARKRIAEASRKRWAAWRASKEAPAKKATKKTAKNAG